MRWNAAWAFRAACGRSDEPMPRKLKTFVTNLGFFELAVAAPSMKAALEAWGLGHNAFKRDLAQQTDDPKIVAAAEAAPGTVLRRPIGSKGPFQEHADLPDAKTVKAPPPRVKEPKRAEPAKRKLSREDRKKPRAPVIDLQAARRAREKEAKERERADAEAERDRTRKERAAKKAMDALAAARERHEKIAADIARKRDALEAQADEEEERWQKERHRLEVELFKAKR
jgi:colicin import membrane protein